MAGLWERVKSGAAVRVPSHLLDAAFVLNATGTFTQQQIIDGLNSQISSPLAAAELTDLGNIVTEMAAQGTNTLKLIYMEKIKAAFICAECGVINEATFRTILDIA